MIDYNLIQICSYSIAIAVIIGLVRFRKISRAYQPFIFAIIIALISEIASPFFIKHYNSNAIVVNVLGVAEYLVWIWQFKKWEPFGYSSKWKFILLSVVPAIAWIIENIVLGRIFIFSSVFALLSSSILVFLAIEQVNRLIVEEKNLLLKNSRFLISCGIMIFHTYKIMIESFYVMKLDESNHFLSNIFIILVFVNLFVNLLYALATIWIPTRQRFTMQY